MNFVLSRELDHGNLWRDHDFSVSTAICIWANYFVTPTMNKAQKELGLGRDDCNVLIALWLYGELTATDICFLQGRPKNSISRAVSRLIETSQIKGMTDAEDGRKTILVMTEAGRATMEALVPIFAERQNLMLRRLNKRQREAMHSMLAMSMEETNRWAEDM